MPTGKASDFVIYEEEFYGGVYESVAQFLSVLNSSSSNAIRLVQQKLKGQYNKESFFKTISNMITRRDTTSVSAVSDLAMTQGELIGVKINRKIGPIAQTFDAWRKIGEDQREMSFILGQTIGQSQAEDYVNTAILAVEAALAGQAALVYDASALTPTSTLTHGHLVKGLAKMGDASNKIVCWVMHSAPWFQLVGQTLTDKIGNVGDTTIFQGTTGSLNRPVLVTDAPALSDTNGSTVTYNVLGLTEDAVVATESESRELVSEPVTGLENLVFRVQGEYAFNLNCKGYKWDTANGGANPTDTAVATSTNWDKAVTSDKDLAGVRIVVSD
jgi:hypothetical protein